MIVLSDLYIDARYFRNHPKISVRQRLAAWLPCVVLVIYTVALANIRNFVPEHTFWLELYLVMLALTVVPKTIFALCSIIGLLFRSRKNYCDKIGIVLAALGVIVFMYGLTFGFSQLEVRHVKIYGKDIPKAFNGYRIVQFSDAHVGTYAGYRRGILERAIDSINAQNADMVVFTGDLQNVVPGELDDFAPLLKSLKAKDGVFSVLGNHDYSQYVNADSLRKREYERETIEKEYGLGWTLLLNENRKIRRGNDSIVIAGEENDGLPPFPHRADLEKTLAGVGDRAFVIMLQHDPSAWKRNILPQSSVQLTLSGHTHGGQMSIFGFRPTMLKYDNDYGLYEERGRHINVSGGLGGVVPFRFLMPGEIVVIELVSL